MTTTSLPRRRRRDPALALGLALTVGLALVAVLAPVLAPGDPSALGPTAERLAPPSAAHLLGTDLLGRDVLRRLVHGARTSLLVGWFSALVGTALGTAVGMAAGLGPRRLERALMLLVDAFLAFPRVLLVLLLVSLATPSTALVILVLGLTGWMSVARLVRAETLSLRERDFVAAARGLGLSAWRVATRHVLPGVVPTVIVAATLRVGGAILTESFLGFVGLGVQEPAVSWGAMIQLGRGDLLQAWWLTTFPGVAIAVTVVGYNLLGDGLRRRFDPRQTEAAHG